MRVIADVRPTAKMAPDPNTENAAPRAATSWIVGLVAFVTVVFVWVVVKVAQTAAWPWYALLLFATCWTALGCFAMWGFVVQIFTCLDSQGVSQLSIRGLNRMRWKDISTVSEKHMGTLVLSDSKSSITIAPMAYNDASAVHQWIRDQLAQTGAPASSRNK